MGPPSIHRSSANEPSFSLEEKNLSIKYHSRKLEETLIRRALEKTGVNRTRAAKLLEISHRTLLYKLKEFGFAQEVEESDDESASEGELPR